jgi:hypothetical protein
MSVRLGTRDLTSLMIFGLAVASKDSSLTLKIVFSFGFSYMTCQSRGKTRIRKADLCRRLLRCSGGCGCCRRGRRHGNLLDVQPRLRYACESCEVTRRAVSHTLSRLMRSAAWRRVRPEMSSTIPEIFASTFAGGGGAAEEDASAEPVAMHRNAVGLRGTCQRDGAGSRRRDTPRNACASTGGDAESRRAARLCVTVREYTRLPARKLTAMAKRTR